MTDIHSVLTLDIDLDDDTPVARQIADGLRVLMVSGQLRPGDALPSARRLAVDLGVHYNTVVQAYRELENEGWLSLARRRGTHVRERPAPPPADAASNAALTDKLARLLARYRAQGIPMAALESAVRDAMDRLKG